jgi:hypothetical protein
VTGAGPTGGPQVGVFANLATALIDSFYAFNPIMAVGLFVAGH